MSEANKAGAIMLSLTVGLIVWFAYSLFHYNHQYKAVNGKLTYIIYSDNPYDKGDRIIYHDSDMGYLEGKGLGVSDTATIIKVLR